MLSYLQKQTIQQLSHRPGGFFVCDISLNNMKEFARQFYKSKAWHDCRQAYINKRINIDGGLCERCHDVTGYIIHHKIHLSPNNINDPDITLNHCNLEYVCHNCHNNIHADEFNNNNKLSATIVNGRVIPFDNDDYDRFQRQQ